MISELSIFVSSRLLSLQSKLMTKSYFLIAFRHQVFLNRLLMKSKIRWSFTKALRDIMMTVTQLKTILIQNLTNVILISTCLKGNYPKASNSTIKSTKIKWILKSFLMRKKSSLLQTLTPFQLTLILPKNAFNQKLLISNSMTILIKFEYLKQTISNL